MFLCLGVLGTLLAFPLTAWVARPLTRDVADLTEALRALARGRPAPTLLLESDRMLFGLGEGFHRMRQAQAERLARLEEDRQQVLAVLGAMVEGVIALDAGQRILFVNGRAGELLRVSPAAEGRPLWEVVRSRPLLDLAERALLGPAGQTLRVEVSGHLPARHNLLVHAADLDGTTGADGRTRPRGAVLVLHDISELRWLERVRQEFVANVSHELKTPLSVINANAETLLDGAVDDIAHRTQFLEQITRQCQRLHLLIQDLLSLARMESGSEIFDIEAVPIEAVVSACLERHRARAKARRLVLEVAPCPDPTIQALADADAFDQILDNLLDNAVKYTPEEGRIRVSWRAEDGQVVIAVTDTGIGIPEADQPRIFERFYRVDKARSQQLGGDRPGSVDRQAPGPGDAGFGAGLEPSGRGEHVHRDPASVGRKKALTCTATRIEKLRKSAKGVVVRCLPASRKAPGAVSRAIAKTPMAATTGGPHAHYSHRRLAGLLPARPRLHPRPFLLSA